MSDPFAKPLSGNQGSGMLAVNPGLLMPPNQDHTQNGGLESAPKGKNRDQGSHGP